MKKVFSTNLGQYFIAGIDEKATMKLLLDRYRGGTALKFKTESLSLPHLAEVVEEMNLLAASCEVSTDKLFDTAAELRGIEPRERIKNDPTVGSRVSKAEIPQRIITEDPSADLEERMKKAYRK
jgi:hypothetical protein